MFIFPYGVPSSDPTYAEVMSAHQALTSAQETGNAELAAAAEAHYQQVLKAALDRHGWSPSCPNSTGACSRPARNERPRCRRVDLFIIGYVEIRMVEA